MRHTEVDHSKRVFASHRKCLCSVSKGSCTHYKCTTTVLLGFVPWLFCVAWVSMYHLYSWRSLCQLITGSRFGCSQLNFMNCWVFSTVETCWEYLMTCQNCCGWASQDYGVGNAILPFNFRKKGWKMLLIQLVDPSGVRK